MEKYNVNPRIRKYYDDLINKNKHRNIIFPNTKN